MPIRRILTNWVIPLSLLLAVVISGTISLYFAPLIHTKYIDAGLSLVQVGIVLLGLNAEDNKKLVWVTLVLGIIADWYYFGFLGIYAILFPATLFVAQKISRFIPRTFWAYLLITLAILLTWQIYMFGLVNLFGVASVSIETFLINSLPATLILGLVIYCLTYHLWMWLIQKYPFYQ